MAPRKTDKKNDIEIARFADHIVIRQPNRLRRAIRRVPEDHIDDAVARAEAALASLAGEFRSLILAQPVVGDEIGRASRADGE